VQGGGVGDKDQSPLAAVRLRVTGSHPQRVIQESSGEARTLGLRDALRLLDLHDDGAEQGMRALAGDLGGAIKDCEQPAETPRKGPFPFWTGEGCGRTVFAAPGAV
jgi:hypothetical protein